MESAYKPGSVSDNHSSRAHVTERLKRPTRTRYGPHRWVPIWSCSEWGLPCQSRYRNRGALLPHLFTLTQLAKTKLGGVFSVALSIGSRRPDVIWHPALRSPDFPRWSTIHAKWQMDRHQHRGCPADSTADGKLILSWIQVAMPAQDLAPGSSRSIRR